MSFTFRGEREPKLSGRWARQSQFVGQLTIVKNLSKVRVRIRIRFRFQHLQQHLRAAFGKFIAPAARHLSRLHVDLVSPAGK